MTQETTTVSGGGDIWNRYAQAYDALNALHPYSRLLSTVCDHLSPQRGHRVLDAGCGTGNLLSRIDRTTETSCVGVDAEAAMLAVAQQKVPSAQLFKANVDETLPFESESFDRIASVNALYPTKNPARVIEGFYQLLRHSGQLVLVNPIPGFDNGWVLKAHCESPKPDSYWENAHASIERATDLITEAVKDPELVRRLLAVAEANIAIKGAEAYHYYHEPDLVELVKAAGFRVLSSRSVYAGVSVLVTAIKES